MPHFPRFRRPGKERTVKEPLTTERLTIKPPGFFHQLGLDIEGFLQGRERTAMALMQGKKLLGHVVISPNNNPSRPKDKFQGVIIMPKHGMRFVEGPTRASVALQGREVALLLIKQRQSVGTG